MTLDMKQVKAVEEASGHSVFGGSSLPRIVSCPASVGMELKAGLRPASKYAAKGTLLHNVTEKALRSRDPHTYVHRQDIDIEDMTYVIDAVDYVFEVIGKHGEGEVVIPTPWEDGSYYKDEIDLWIAGGKVVVLLEAYGDLTSYGIPESRGSADVVIMSLLRTDVVDHKFGHGVAVYAEDNYQLVAYLGMAVPFIEHPDADHELYVHINQPTLQIFDEWRVGWDVFYKMLLGDVADAVAEAKGPDPRFGPSTKACRFCNANMGCKVRHKWLMEKASLVTQLAKDPAHIPNEKWAEFLMASEALKTAISQVEKHAVTEIQKGHEFPGFKLVAGKSNRKFVDEESAQEYMKKRLGKKAYKPAEFISLAQAEKVDKSLKDNDDWKGMIHKPPGKPKLVRALDKRKALEYGTSGIMNRMARGEV